MQKCHGIFTRYRVLALADFSSVESVTVIAPVPSFPLPSISIWPYASLKSIPEKETFGPLAIYHPRYVNVPRLGMRIQPYLMAKSLISTVKKLMHDGYEFDVIDAYYFYPDGVAAAKLAREIGKPLVITAYGSDLSFIPKVSGYAAKQIHKSANQAGATTVVCQALANLLLELGVNKEKVHIIMHGVNLELFSPIKNRSELRKTLNMRGRCLLSVGHLTKHKGMHFAIKGLECLPSTHLYIAGSGREELNLRRLSTRCNVEGRVHFLGELIPSQLRRYMCAADVLVQMSSREGIPNVIMESLACGTPVVATAVGGIPEVICTTEAGRLVLEKTELSLANTLNDVFSDLPDRNMTRRYAENFTWEETSCRHIRALSQALNSTKITKPFCG
jgi:glycosyltransferase involved in cell wall biosynthesis